MIVCFTKKKWFISFQELYDFLIPVSQERVAEIQQQKKRRKKDKEKAEKPKASDKHPNVLLTG